VSPRNASRPGVPDLSRRRFLAMAGLGVTAAAATPLLAACGSSSSSKTAAAGSSTSAAVTDLTVQLSWVEDTEFSPLYLADSNGHYKTENVSIKLIPGGSDIGAIEGIVAAGKADIGIATDITSTIAAAADGNPLVVIGAMYQSNLQVLLSPPDKPVTTVKDLVGKKIGGPQGIQTKFDAIFKLAGLKPDYKYIPTGYGPDALINGDCDVLAGFVTDEALSYATVTGKTPAILSFTDAGLPAYTLPIFTTKDVLSSKRDALKGFLRATLKGYDEDIADPEAGPKLAVSTYGKSAGLKLPSEIEHNKAYIPLASSDATKEHGYMWIDKDFLSGAVYKGMVASGLKTVPVDDVLDVSLLQEIKEGK
jgi:ABC-type nitrate/sulfonate/bicarbonate transport system substrate-binding protein